MRKLPRVICAVVASACGRVDFDARGDGGADAGADAGGTVTLLDTFARPDDLNVGNGWIEKRANVFGIANGRVVRTDFATDYRDNITYRPSNEDVLDVESSIEFRVGHIPPGYPQVFARVQQASVTVPNTIDGYILYIDGGTTSAKITRQLGTTLPPALATFAIAPPLDTTSNYRLRLRVTGTAPVALACYVEVQAGATWTAIGQVTTVDSDATAIIAPGAVAFSAGQPEASGYYTYGTFTRVAP